MKETGPSSVTSETLEQTSESKRDSPTPPRYENNTVNTNQPRDLPEEDVEEEEEVHSKPESYQTAGFYGIRLGNDRLSSSIAILRQKAKEHTADLHCNASSGAADNTRSSFK